MGHPRWVPADAKIHIDFLGGSPQGRAWSNGAEVAIDTLLGNDPNTENGWGIAGYDPANLTTDGYGGSDVAAIGFLRDAVLSGSTFAVLSKDAKWGKKVDFLGA